MHPKQHWLNMDRDPYEGRTRHQPFRSAEHHQAYREARIMEHLTSQDDIYVQENPKHIMAYLARVMLDGPLFWLTR